MLVDLNLQGKAAVVLGGGEESELKVRKLLDAGARVTVISVKFDRGLRKLAKSSLVNLLQAKSTTYESLLKRQKPYAVVVATEDHDMDIELARTAQSLGALVCVVDRPHLNDFNMPAIAKIGDVRVAISTSGMSPAMAGLLRRRIERIIKPEHALQVKLQGQVREIIKKTITNPTTRKKVVYKIICDRKIKNLLRQNLFEKAKIRAVEIIHNLGPSDIPRG